MGVVYETGLDACARRGVTASGALMSCSTAAQVRRNPDPWSMLRVALSLELGGAPNLLTFASRLPSDLTSALLHRLLRPSHIVTALRQHSMIGINFALLSFILGGIGVISSSAGFVSPPNVRLISLCGAQPSHFNSPAAAGRRINSLCIRRVCHLSSTRLGLR